MLRLYKAYMARFLQNVFFLGGCVIALVVTFAVTSNRIVFPFLEDLDPSRRMFFVTAAMVAFFTIFVPVFSNMEYTDGVIRNKMIPGFSQKQIFFSQYLSYVSLALIMWLCYLIGGIAGGANPFGEYLTANLVFLVALMSFISVVLMLSFRVTKTVVIIIIAGMMFSASFNMVLFGNLILMIASDSGNAVAELIAALIYNVNTLGQWFALSGFADDYANPGTPLQILLSLMVILLMTVLGTLGLKKRDLV